MDRGNVLGAIADAGHAASKQPYPEIACLGLAVVAGGMHFGHLDDRLVGLALCVVVALVALGFGARATSSFGKPDGLRVAGLGASLAAALLALAPVFYGLFPGQPDAEVDVAPSSPARLETHAGAHRILVSGQLPQDGTADHAEYDLAVGDRHLQGEFVRTFEKGRVRGGTGLVHATDHGSNFHDADLGAGENITFELRGGKVQGPVHVAAYRGPPRELVWLLPALVLLLGAFIDDRLGAKLKLAVPVAFGAVFGLLMYRWGTPVGAWGSALGSGVLGFIAAAVLGWAATLAVRLVPR